MRVFLTGATGYIGSAVAEALQAAGHSVLGAARNVEAEQVMKDAGITPVSSDLAHSVSLKSPAEMADAVIHAGTTNDGHVDAEAIEAMLVALEGSNKPFIYTSGVWVLGNTGDTPATEDSPVNPVPIVAWRPSVDQRVMSSARKGIRAVVVRPAVVYGRGAGLCGMFVQTANETGAARYIGAGTNRWPLVHVEDLAELFVLALDQAKPGSLYNAADGPSVATRDIAEAASFGAGGAGRTESIPVEQAEKSLGAAFVAALLLDQTVSGEKAKRELGWKPHGVGVLEDLRYGSYAMAKINP